MTTIIIKNSSTTGAAPTASDLVQGELAVNVTDTGLYTENASGTVVKLNAPSIDDENTGAIKYINIGSDALISLQNSAGLAVARTGVTSPASTDGNVFSGTYTPTQVSTNGNVASVSYGGCQYMRVGNIVTVSGQVTVTATAANTNTQVRFSLPIASNMSSSRHLGGSGGSASTSYGGGGAAIFGDPTNDCVDMRFSPVNTNALAWTFSFTYQVI